MSRALSRLKLVHKKWQKGVRKDLYEAEHDQFRSFVDFFSQLWEKEIELNQKTLKKAEKNLTNLLNDPELTPDEKEQVESDLSKLEQAQLYYTWLEKLAHSFESGEIFKHVPIPNQKE